MANMPEESQIQNVVIEPQSKTEDMVPYYFHMLFMLAAASQPKKQPIDLFRLIKLHPTINEAQKKMAIDEILFGTVKANNEQQYGYGLEALRLWIAKNDHYLGDRNLIEREINKEIKFGQKIRKLYW